MTRLPASKAPVLSEDAEQIAFVAYLEARGLRFTAIPNSTYTTHMSVKVRNKRLGLRAGFPDMVICIPHVGMAYVEMKRTKGGRATDDQLEWIDDINLCPGAEARVCKGAIEAIRFIEELSPSGYDTTSIF